MSSTNRPTQPRSRGGAVPTSHLESTITRLLVCTKALLEGLAKWSRQEVTEEDISAIYVRLGNDFNLACAVFARENISMNELLSVPSDLRVCLETCLSDAPSQATLERHLPQVRQIIIGLLHGLREKQRLYRDGVAARRAREGQERTGSVASVASSAAGSTGSYGTGSASNPNVTGPISNGGQQPLTPTSAGRSKEDLRRFVNQAQQAAAHPAPQHQNSTSSSSSSASTSTTSSSRYPATTTDRRAASEESSRPVSTASSSTSAGSRSVLSTRSGSLRDPTTASSRASTTHRPVLDPSSTFSAAAPPSAEPTSYSTTTPTFPPTSSLPPLPRTGSDASITSSATTATSSRPPALAPIPPPERTNSQRSISRASSQASTVGRRSGSPPPPPREVEAIPRTPTLDSFPSSTYFPPPTSNNNNGPSLPPPIPTINTPRPPSVDVASGNASSPRRTSQQPVVPGQGDSTPTSASLEALKASDNMLSRRASKRYSAYAIQKMTSPGGGGGSSAAGAGDATGPGMTRSIEGEGGVRRSKTTGSTAAGGGGSDHSPRPATHHHHRTTSSFSSGAEGPLPPLPAIPRSFSSTHSLASRTGSTRSPITEEIEVDDESEGEREGARRGHDETRPDPTRSASSSSSSSPTFAKASSGPPKFPPPPLPRTGSTSSVQSTSTRNPLPPLPTSASAPSTVGPASPSIERSSSATLLGSTASDSTSRPDSPAPFSHQIGPESNLVSPSPTPPFAIYLQISRSVRKAQLNQYPPTTEVLRQLFVERFGYHPGVNGWPEIYIKENGGVAYELEEMDEVRDGVVLSLNIDTVEQVKQHIDLGLTSLAQDIKELRTHVFSIRRQSVSASTLSAALSAQPAGAANGPHSSPGGFGTLVNPFATTTTTTHHGMLSPDARMVTGGPGSPGTGGEGGRGEGGGGPLRPSPSEAQFQDAAARVLRMKRMGSVAGTEATEGQPERSKGDREGKGEAEDEANSTGASGPGAEARTTTVTTTTTANTAPAIVATLKSQHSEVLNLRREISVLRQVYVDFTTQTKDLFSTVRLQNNRVHHLASTKLAVDRQFVEAGTAKLEQDSTNLVVKVDELQDTVEQLREDTVKGVRPRPAQLSEMNVQLRKAIETRTHLVEWLKQVKPGWSQKWSEELSKILGEQKAVETQETLLNELKDDLDDVETVFDKIQAVARQLKPSTASTGSSSTTTNGLSSSGGPGTGSTRSNLRELGGGDSQEGLSTVLLEVRALQPDPAKRLEAIAKAERQRTLALSNRTDEFADELGEFVGRGKLKKSGGIEETERVRQARSEATLKAMFSS
ncbi:hypothetical protein JCM10212_004296 [Sporobolomyces blumeae]